MVKQMLADPQKSYRFIMGVRDPAKAQAAYEALPGVDAAKTQMISYLPLELNDLRNVKHFATQTLGQLEESHTTLDYLFLNAALNKPANEPKDWHSKWSEQYLTNDLSQNYLIHLLKDKIIESKARVIFVSSGAATMVKDPSVLDKDLLAGSGTDGMKLYCETKFTQLLNAHWWRRQLGDKAEVLATSPGMVPGTGLGRHVKPSGSISSSNPSAISVPQGATNMLRTFAIPKSEWPKNQDQIFLTSWGEWWGLDVIKASLDKELQDKWSPSKDEIEKGEGIA
jgi:NAD(P)-dependent dehydrogenase (short-subunit alcohol dehydrogenase family)